MIKNHFKTLFLILMFFARPVSCEELKGNQEVIGLTESWLSSIGEPQEDTPEAFAWYSSIPHPRFNCILHFSYRDHLEKHIDELIGKAPSNAPITFWLDPKSCAPGLREVLKNRNFIPAGSYPSMSWDVTPTPSPKLEIRDADMEIFHEILGASLHYSEEVKQGSLRLLREKKGEHYIVHLDGKPVGTGTLFIQGDIGAVFHVATLPEYQKRGVGRAMMQFIMHQASNRGLKKLVLVSSHVAERLYLSLGFQKVDDVEIYIREG